MYSNSWFKILPMQLFAMPFLFSDSDCCPLTFGFNHLRPDTMGVKSYVGIFSQYNSDIHATTTQQQQQDPQTGQLAVTQLKLI